MVDLLRIVSKIVTELVDLDAGPFLSHLKAEFCGFSCFSAQKHWELRRSVLQFIMEVELHFLTKKWKKKSGKDKT